MRIRNERGGYYDLVVRCDGMHNAASCLRELGHPGKHLDYFGNYWGSGRRMPACLKTGNFWRGVLVALIACVIFPMCWASR